MSDKVYLNGNFVDSGDAHISIFDRGFLFGDGVYEVIPVYGGKLFRFEQHIERLNNSLSAILIDPVMSADEWRKIAKQLVEQLPGEDQAIYLQVTRGDAGERDHRIPEQIEPTILMMTKPMTTPDPAIKQGISAVTREDVRWKLCNIKTIALLANVLAKHEATVAGAAEAVLIRDGLAYEGAASNLFVVKDGLVITPPKSQFLLPGITRDLVIELLHDGDIPWSEASISRDDLNDADEIWLTSSTKEIAPVISLDGAQVGDGKPGAIWHKTSALYDACIERLRRQGECH